MLKTYEYAMYKELAQGKLGSYFLSTLAVQAISQASIECHYRLNQQSLLRSSDLILVHAREDTVVYPLLGTLKFVLLHISFPSWFELLILVLFSHWWYPHQLEAFSELSLYISLSLICPSIQCSRHPNSSQSYLLLLHTFSLLLQIF